MNAYDEAARVVRERSRDRFIADLFVPESARRHLFALHAFNAEISRVRFTVSEPALGEIRLQWWRDAIVNREGAGNPLADALLTTIADNNLPVGAFEALLTARIFDLYNDPMPTMADFEGYAGETESALFQLASLALNSGRDPGSADASGHAGVAMAMRDALKYIDRDARRRQLFLPRDRLEASGVDVEQIFAREANPETEAALTELRDTAVRHLSKARAEIARLPDEIRLAFLPMTLVKPDLARINPREPFQTAKEMPQWRRQLVVWQAARRGLK